MDADDTNPIEPADVIPDDQGKRTDPRGRWTTFRTVESDADIADDPASVGIHHYQIKKLRDGWRLRIVQANGSRRRAGPVNEIPASDGEAIYAAVKGLTVVSSSAERAETPSDVFFGRVQQLLTSRGLTHKAFARTLGMTPTPLNDMFRVRARPRPETIRKIADALGVGIGELWPAPEESAKVVFEPAMHTD